MTTWVSLVYSGRMLNLTDYFVDHPEKMGTPASRDDSFCFYGMFTHTKRSIKAKLSHT